MAEELLEKITTKTLKENIPAHKCWELAAKILTKIIALRVHLTRPLFGEVEGIIAPVMGWEKYEEIFIKFEPVYLHIIIYYILYSSI